MIDSDLSDVNDAVSEDSAPDSMDEEDKSDDDILVMPDKVLVL